MTCVVDAIDRLGQTWHITHDALTIAARQVRLRGKDIDGVSRVLSNTEFEEGSQGLLEEEIAACKQAASDFAILSMWAVFERRLIARLEAECRRMQDVPPSEFNRNVLDKVVNAVEFWRIDDALDLIKPLAGSDLVGQVKQIKQYRDWVAHRNPRKSTPAKIDPLTAMALLKNLVTALDHDGTVSLL